MYHFQLHVWLIIIPKFSLRSHLWEKENWNRIEGIELERDEEKKKVGNH